MTDVYHDLRFAFRTLAKDRRFTLTAIIALTLGIGATTTMFSVIYGVIVNPFPYRDASRLATFGIQNLTNSGGSKGRNFFLIPEFLAFRNQNHVFEDMVGYAWHADFLYSDGASTHQFPGAYVTTNTFDFYGVTTLVGRGITAEDGKPNAAPVFVMNYRLWQTLFGADPTILGKIFVIDGIPRTLVGIMPARFDLYKASVWMPLSLDPGADGSAIPVARMKPGTTLQAAAADLDVIAHRPGGFPEHFAINIESFRDNILGNFKRTLYALLAAVVMLLLIACANVANLLLARATLRAKEIAIRASLGASRTRLIRQLLVESFVLGGIGCVAGCSLSYFGLKGIVAVIPQGTIPGETIIDMSPVVLAFSVAVTILTTLICGIVPALHASRCDLQSDLTGSGRGLRSHFGRSRLRDALVISQIAISIVLLIGAGLMIRSFFALTHVDLPFDSTRLFYAQLALPRSYYANPDKKPDFFRKLLPHVVALPGVISASESLMVPPNEDSWTDVVIPGKPHSDRWLTDLELCTEGYFQTLGLQVVEGRLLSESDIASTRHVAVVNQLLARQYFGEENPIGRKIKLDIFDRPFLDAPHDTYFDIVGVVENFKTNPERTKFIFRPEIFVPASVAAFGHPINILVRTSVNPNSLLRELYQEIWQIDPGVAIASSGTIESLLEREYQGPRFELVTLCIFAAIGLVLVGTGVFGVIACTVSSGMHDIGIRLAVGARPADIFGMILRKGARLIAAGILAGIIASIWLTRFMDSEIWGVPRNDAWTFGAVTSCVFLVGLGACLLPARRAMQVDPLITLRGD